MELLAQLHAGLGDRYDVERELGGGAMSRVFLARDRLLGRLVVVKTLSPELASSLSMERFHREIEVCAHLQHPHILPLLAADNTQGLPYFVTPYVEGESLRNRLTRDGRPAIGLALRVMRDVAEALDYAHAHGVVHRDIKPGNILLAGDHAIVTDFGVAKVMLASAGWRDGTERLTGRGMSLGTPEYMAPEQATADPNADHRVDIYALGMVSYEMLCGHSPFAGRSSVELIAAQVMEQPTPVNEVCSSVPADLAALVMRCLAKNPDQRPQRASEIVQAVEARIAENARRRRRGAW